MKTRKRMAKVPAVRLVHPEIAVIYARLSPFEQQAFHEAKVPYSGATSRWATTFDDLEPYIAAFYHHLPDALKAFGWTRVNIEVREGQWIVTRKRRQ